MLQSADVERHIFSVLEKEGSVLTSDIDAPYEVVIGTAKKLEALGYVNCTAQQIETCTLTEEAEEIVRTGSPEYLLYSVLSSPIPVSGDALINEFRKNSKYIGMDEKKLQMLVQKGKNRALQNKIVKINNGCLEKAEVAEDSIRELLQKSPKHMSADELALLKKRRLLQIKKTTHYRIEKGSKYSKELAGQGSIKSAPEIADITPEVLFSLNGIQNLKSYNFNIVSAPARYSGARHPLSLERRRVKRIFLDMGFVEMDAAKYIESSFWNFDALFQPQNHPSRDEQDTFFLQTPGASRDPDQDYLQRVKSVHEKGGYGSKGYRTEWSLGESRKNVLRTHTTAVTARLLKNLAGKTESGKYFSIDRVFRNESLDATHLAEFHQVEGIIMGRGLTISHLMGFLETFFEKLGIKRIKFKPAYNPYTEPSVEVFGYHEEMQRWMEIGNSGMFRPEMLQPMGFAEDIKVIGWGISLERPVMIQKKIGNIRDLVGHKVDFGFIRGE